ncbi:MAG: DUF4241 domain-containing protein [Planctomycetes bacterium]|nr:DUF4241 domain-containing protein [Planctomycetota bacterium]
MWTRQLEIGNLVLPTGSIIACDPSCLEWDAVPFTERVPPGTYPVSLCLVGSAQERGAAAIGTHKRRRVRHARVACAMVRFTLGRSQNWEMALRPGQDLSALPLGKLFGYGVDAGQGCFIDSQTASALPADYYMNFYESQILGVMDEGPMSRLRANVLVDEKTGGNIVVFESGLGDGAYPSYWGCDAQGEICSLVTDFGLLVENLEGIATLELGELIDREILHPDFAKIGLTVRIRTLGEPSEHRLLVQLKGGYARIVISNAGKEYSTDRMMRGASGGKEDLYFRFDGPLRSDATIRFEYGLGVRAFESEPG